MKNREWIEVYKCCKGDIPINTDKISNEILDSEISIKDFCKISENCVSLDKDKILYDGLDYIFSKKEYGWSDDEVGELLKTIRRLLKEYQDYFGYFIGGMYETKLIDKIREIKHVREIRDLKILTPLMVISLDRVDYDVRYQSFEGMVLCKLVGDENTIENIGAILFKDKKYEIEFVHDKNDLDKVSEKVGRFDYDMVLMCHSIRKGYGQE